MKNEEIKSIFTKKYIGHIAFERTVTKHIDDDGARGTVCFGLKFMMAIFFSDIKSHRDLIRADELFFGFLQAIIDDKEEMYSDDEKRVVQSFLNIFIETMKLDSTFEYITEEGF